RKAIEQAGGEPVEVRSAADLSLLDALIVPGGESTTMLKLLREEHLFEPLREFGAKKPVFGTCAGAILLASEVLNPRQESLGLMDMSIERNAYGRQIDSHIAQIEFEGKSAEAVFIRAPAVRRVGPEARVLATYLDAPVVVEQGLHMVSTFHPELGADNRFHKRLVEKAVSARLSASRPRKPMVCATRYTEST
ncbi:MAG: pyridoxal 5'-phosphate synthase glutaminase subunit PdxT, partial [Bryobacteraceae bacterium]